MSNTPTGFDKDLKNFATGAFWIVGIIGAIISVIATAIAALVYFGFFGFMTVVVGVMVLVLYTSGWVVGDGDFKKGVRTIFS